MIAEPCVYEEVQSDEDPDDEEHSNLTEVFDNDDIDDVDTGSEEIERDPALDHATHQIDDVRPRYSGTIRAALEEELAELDLEGWKQMKALLDESQTYRIRNRSPSRTLTVGVR